ncbi:serine/threonine-protein kinase PEPKR2 [Gossypium australe]|uniref:Serine/threonine-protein kinase PEPKR2 n=1 Tax=Gossypium australe TaxID=47621 RepID=A0A5B6VYP6_9ROSI|nr:serine/threonine-protein kinase PEPKR2 [Gossypium australe]
MHDLHIFIFALAVFHVLYSVATILLAKAKLELIIMEMAEEIQERSAVVRGAPVVEPNNNGTRIKTRKRNIAAPLDPSAFADAVVQIYLDNAGDLVAPEVLLGNYSEKVDILSAGVLLHVLLVGVLPFQGDSLKAVFEAIKNVKLDFRGYGNLIPSAVYHGISFSDLFWVTKRNMALAVKNLTKHLDSVSDALSASCKEAFDPTYPEPG